MNYVKDGRITIEDIREKKVFAKVPETKLERNLVNGYSNIIPLLVEKMLTRQSGVVASFDAPISTNARVLIIDEINPESSSLSVKMAPPSP